MQPLHLNEISDAIQVRHLENPIGKSFCVRPTQEAQSCAIRMATLQFDVAPVMEDGTPIGIFMAGASGDGAVKEHMRTLASSMIVSADTPVSALVRHLEQEPFLLVLQGREITGFVTPADVGAAPARTHYYLLVSTLEISLHQYLSSLYPDQRDVLGKLSPGARGRQARIEAELRAADQFIDTLSTLSLQDLLDLAGKDPAFRARATGTRGWNWLCDNVIAFRDDVMHPSRAFARADKGGLARVIDMEVRLTTLATAAENALAENGTN